VSTHVSPSTETSQKKSNRSIVVGIDTRGRSVSALVWAVDEAERDGSALVLISATRGSIGTDQVGQHDVGALARRLSLMDVEQRAVEGPPVEVLLDASVQADLLVVGARTMSPARRIVAGGTSRALACWSPVPVVIVPEPWMQPSMAAAPIVAGIRPADSEHHDESGPLDEEVLAFAFTRASELRVPLVVVSAGEIPNLYAWSASDVEAARHRYDASLDERLSAWRTRYPDVEVTARNVAEKPAQAALDASNVAQLVVVGRHHSRSLSGLLGGTARGVLRGSTRPVAVVPAGARSDLVRDMKSRRDVANAGWGPTF
jgi:nucleotide-binding universal stress UspA family protein